MAFKMRSQSVVSNGGFKMMGSSPMKNDGHDAPKGHVHDKNDRNKWTSQEVAEDADGKKTIRTSKGTVGTPGTPDKVIENPGTSTDTDPVVKKDKGDKKDTPGTKPKTYPDDHKTMGKACSAAYIAKWGEDACNAYKKKKKEGTLPTKDKKDPVETETKTTPKTEGPTTTVIKGDPGTKDTREDKVIEAGPGKDAITSDIDFWDASKKGRKSNRKKNRKNKGKKGGGGGSGGSGICNRDTGEGCSVNW